MRVNAEYAVIKGRGDSLVELYRCPNLNDAMDYLSSIVARRGEPDCFYYGAIAIYNGDGFSDPTFYELVEELS